METRYFLLYIFLYKCLEMVHNKMGKASYSNLPCQQNLEYVVCIPCKE